MKSGFTVIYDIDSLNLNDSEIKEVRITQLNEIEIDIQLILSYETQESAPHRLVFSDCQSARLELNLAYEGTESIHSSSQSRKDTDYLEYCIVTNTAGSTIRVVARRLLLKRLT
jgi:hypothetical protein